MIAPTQRNRPEAADPLMPATLRFPRSGNPIRDPDRVAARRHRLGATTGRSRGHLHRLVAAIARFQRVVICVADDDIETYADIRLRSNRVDMDRVRFVPPCPTTTPGCAIPGRSRCCAQRQRGVRLLDFRFTGWGGKFGASRDDQLVGALVAHGPVRDDYFVKASISRSKAAPSTPTARAR